MLKLRLSVDISLSKVMLGVAGISATVCAFQYFMSNNNKEKPSLEIQNSCSGDITNGKGNEVKSAGQTVNSSSCFKLVCDTVKYQNECSKLSFDEYKKNNTSCKVKHPFAKPNSSYKKENVSTDLISAGKINKHTQTEVIEKSDKIDPTNVNLADFRISFESSKSSNKKEIKHADSSTQTDKNQCSVNCNKVLRNDASVMNTTVTDFKESATKSDGLSEATEQTNSQIKEHNVCIDEQEERQDSSVNKIDVEEIKVDGILEEKKEHFQTISRYIVAEKDFLEDHFKIGSLNKPNKNGISLQSIYDKFCKRVDVIRKQLVEETVHKTTSEFVLKICAIEQALWKKAAKEVKHSNKFLDVRHNKIKELFQWLKII